jgi:hypothetical protein
MTRPVLCAALVVAIIGFHAVTKAVPQAVYDAAQHGLR